MSDPKDSQSFFRKVVKFVANPATDWSNLGADTAESRDSESAKIELKAMIERKRRNDFVRKREFDMLRKVRREGLTSEQAAALDGQSNLNDSEVRLVESAIRADSGVKAKIDEIEQQMAGDSAYAAARRSPDARDAPIVPAHMPRAPATTGMSWPSLAAADARPRDAATAAVAGAKAPGGIAPATGLPQAQAAPVQIGGDATDFAQAFAVEVNEVVHDPELDDAVISFANADFDQCEHALVSLVSDGGARASHAETWLVLFDLYRATAQQQKFEQLALDYARRFGWSAPQWYSMPQLVAAAAAEQTARPRVDGRIGWACPAVLDGEGVARLASQTLHMPLPWVFDWSALTHIDAQTCARLSELLRSWMGQPLDMRWLAGERLLGVLQDAAPVGARDVDPAFWQLRLDALRMAHRADQFDEAAIDYCVTYEVSPPSWEPVRCRVRIGNTSSELDASTQPPTSLVSEISMNFFESQLPLDAGRTLLVGQVSLAGQLVGDIGETLEKFDRQLVGSSAVTISCLRLIRVDFLAAGDLLNWVLMRRAEGRSLVFIDAHRLIALFFSAMGIDEHARVKVRPV
jgi:hypothetical protein